MSNWNHSICWTCWIARGNITPLHTVEYEACICCYCGERHTSGIYLRGDPTGMPCNHDKSDFDNQRVDWFAQEMKLTLASHKNVQKRDWREDATLTGLFPHLCHELKELEIAITTESVERIISECTDVANLAMMIADWVKTYRSIT